MLDPRERAAALSCWTDTVDPQPVGGGITNQNYAVVHGGKQYFVRLGGDIAVHNILRWHELASSRAAHLAHLSPRVHHTEPGALVLDFIVGQTLDESAIREPSTLARVLELTRRVHTDMATHFRGPVLMFWVFQVLREYAATLADRPLGQPTPLAGLMDIAAVLERAVGPIDVCFSHNDLLAANFIDDGERLWLVDWEYAGFNSPLFDLGGLASNNALLEDQELWMLEAYFDATPTDELRKRYGAMKCASLLRETLWSMVSEQHSQLDVDYVAYTAENLERFESTWSEYQRQWHP